MPTIDADATHDEAGNVTIYGYISACDEYGNLKIAPYVEPNPVFVSIAANGQVLSVVEAPAVLANAVVERLIFDVGLSSHWDGFASYSVLLRRSGGIVCACSIEGGRAVAGSEALAGAGPVEVAIMARDGERRLTSSRVIIQLEDSGL